MVHNHSRSAIVALTLTILLLVSIPTVAIGAEEGEIELTIGTSGLDPLSREKALGSGPFCGLGQRLIIPDRLITEIGYRVWKWGNPTGDVTLSIRDFATGNSIVSVVWGDASELPDPDAGGIRKVRLNEPVRVNGEVVICVEFYGGNMTDYCLGGYRTNSRDHDYRVGETYINYYHHGGWHDIGEAEEGGYYYAYVDEGVVDSPQDGNGEPQNGNSGENGEGGTVGGANWAIIGPVAGALVAGGGFVLYRRRRKKTPE